MKVIVVGGVAGGASAAARLRRLNEHAEIIILEKERYISYANCGLPYYLGEVIKNRDELFIQTPEDMKIRFNIDVRTESEVTAINTEEKTVTVKSKTGGIYRESYDYLVLSPGARAFRPNIPGINSDRVLTLKNIPDTDTIKYLIDVKGMKSAAVIGGGFIGIETAENLAKKGISVTVVELFPHILAQFDEDIAVLLEKELVKNGINLFLNTYVTAIDEKEDKLEVSLSNGERIIADFVIAAAGIVPDTDFLKGSGIELGPKGHIIVNERMQTNVENAHAPLYLRLALHHAPPYYTQKPLAHQSHHIDAQSHHH